MGIISFLGNKEFYFIPYQLAGHSGITWFLTLEEGEIVDNKYTVFNSINYYNLPAAAVTAGIAGIGTLIASGISTLTEGVFINPALAKVEYDIESPTEWGLTYGLIPEDFKKGEFTTFNSLSDWGKWVVLSNNLIDELGDDAKQADEDYSFLNSTSMLNIVNTENEDPINSAFISQRIDRTFRKFKEKETISEVEQEFFSNYSSFALDKNLVASIRMKIIKQTGDSNFIAKEFGIENFFTLRDFEERIAEKIREEIKKGSDKNESYPLNAAKPDGYSKSVDLIKNLLKLRFSGLGMKMVGWGEREDIIIQPNKLSTETYKALEQRAGRIDENPFGTTSILYSDLLDTEIYENPTRFDIIDAFIDDGSPGKTQEIYLYRELSQYYSPDVEKERINWHRIKKYWGFIDSDTVYGIDELIFGYYLMFIDALQFTVREEIFDALLFSIGELFDSVADKAYPYIMNWVVVYYENLVRYNLALLIKQKDPVDLQNLNDNLRTAEVAADLNLQGMQGDLGEEELTEEDIQQRIQLYKQCVLLLNAQDLKQDHINSIINNSNKDMHKTSYYNNRFYMVESKEDNLSIKNKLISPSGSKIKPFMEITPDIMSALKPRLRIYKIYQVRDKDDSTKKRTVSFEFPFPSYTSTDRVNVFNGQEIDRGDGLGIKSFNFSFDGETPATSQQYISADLSLFFQSFSDFVKERVVPNGRSDGQEEKFRYVDLFVNTKNCPPDLSSTSPLNYDPQYYRIRVDVGWEPRTDDSFKQILINRGLDPTEFNEALAVMNKSFYLNLVDHEINISDSGTVTISANYIAYIEGLMENNNVLLSAEAKQLQDEFVGKYEAERRKKNCDKNELAELKASINAIRVSSRNILHQSLIEKLVKNNCMYFAQVESKSRREFASRKFFAKKPNLVHKNVVAYQAQLNLGSNGDPLKVAESIVLSENSTTSENYKYIMNQFLSNPKQNNMERVSFFYLADLVYFLLDPIYVDREPEEQIKVILSSFSIEIPYTGDVSLNIGQIPIEIEVFTKWYKDEIIDKELDSISFLEFIKRLTFYLITDIFSEICVDQQQHRRFSFMNAAINSIKDSNGQGGMQFVLDTWSGYDQPILDLDIFYRSGWLPLATSALNQERLRPSDFVQYLLIYPHHRPETHAGLANALEDAKSGVHHLYIGANKGILKNASFSKSDIQYLRESRMLTQGENGLLQLSSLYRANLKMIGNTIFYPGMLLYLNPFGFGGMDFGLPHQGPGTTEDPNLSNIMGIGGYQKVVKVSSTISDSGKFETDVECIFEHTGEPRREDAENQTRSPGQRSGSDQQDIRKITCTDLDKIDAQEKRCDPTDISKDLQNQLLKLNRQGTIDKRGNN